MSEIQKEAPKPGAALLYSGGMDSYLAYLLYRPAVAVYVASGHRYQDAELRALGELRLPFTVDRSLSLTGWERSDYTAIVPTRNLLFACVASRYADTVWLASLRGEHGGGDKSDKFYAQAGELLRTCYESSKWCEGRAIEVKSPTSWATKAELLRACLAGGLTTKDAVARTSSCYSPPANGSRCGRCYSCARRAVATLANGYVEDYPTDPLEHWTAWSMLARAAAGGYYDPGHTREILQAYHAEGLDTEQLKELAAMARVEAEKRKAKQ